VLPLELAVSDALGLSSEPTSREEEEGARATILYVGELLVFVEMEWSARM
jgi:hypothetical protein